MKFVNDPTTTADNEALLVAARSDAYVVPVLVALGIIAGTTMALVGQNETVKTIGAGVVGSAVSGLIGAKHSSAPKGEGSVMMPPSMAGGGAPPPPSPAPPAPPAPPIPMRQEFVAQPEPAATDPIETGFSEDTGDSGFLEIEQELPRNEMGLPIRSKSIPIHRVLDPADDFLAPTPGLADIRAGLVSPITPMNAPNRNLDGLAGQIFRLDDDGRELEPVWG